MTMREMGFGVVLAAFLGQGCSGGAIPGRPVADTGKDAVDVLDAVDVPEAEADAPEAGEDVSEVADADVPVDGEIEVPPDKPPVLKFWFVTADGPVGADEAEVSLKASDEPAAYVGTPGFQVDVVVESQNLENGRDVQLFVAGNLVATEKIVVNPDTGAGQVTLPAITLTHDPDGYEVRVKAVNQANLEGSSAKIVKVDIGTCGVDVNPKNAACILQDADPAKEGFQVVYTVSNPEKSCNFAKIIVKNGTEVQEFGPVALSETGTAQVEATLLPDTTNVDGVQVIVSAQVGDSTALKDRSATSPDLTYTLDLVDPVVTLTSPSKTSLTLLDDKDADPANGLTFDIAGSASGLAVGGSIEVTSNGSALGSAVPDANGAWLLADQNWMEDGSFAIVASGKDACGRVGEASVTVQIKVTHADYSFVVPAQGETLYAKDDPNPATTTVYEVPFVIFAEGLEPGTTLTVLCRADAFGAPELAVGSAKFDTASGDKKYAVPVTLDVGTLGQKAICRVKDDAANPGTSSEVSFTLALPPPILKILTPKQGEIVNRDPLPVAIFADGLNGVFPLVEIRDGAGNVAVSFVPLEPIQSGGAVYQIPLANGGQPIPEGAYTLVVDAIDPLGNQASDIAGNVTHVGFTLDRSAPTVSIVRPDHDVLDPAVNPGDGDEDAVALGFQTTVVVEVTSGGGDGTEVCLTLNHGKETCVTLAGGVTQAVFSGQTFLPGPNEVSAYATDSAGNQGETVTKTFTLVVPGPRVDIVAPSVDGPVAKLPFDLVVQVTDAALEPQEGALVTLATNGMDQETRTTDATGRASFLISTLSETGDVFVARAEVGGILGYSLPRTLNLKTTAPDIAFVTPMAGDMINLAYAACSPGATNCALTVRLEAFNLENGSPGTLTYDCGLGPTHVSAAVKSGALSFPDVVLKDQSLCSLTVVATDFGGQAAVAGPITVRVDRVRPVLVEFVSPDKSLDTLSYLYDEDQQAPGMQITFMVRVTGAEAGREATLSYGLVGQPAQVLVATVTNDVPDTTSAILVYPRTTLADGVNKIDVALSDLAGNPAKPLSRTLTVSANVPMIRIAAPTFVDRKPCATSADCEVGGYCGAGFCALPWAAASTKSLVVAAVNLPEATNNIRLCADAPSLQGTACSTAGFRQVGLGTVPPGSGTREITVTGTPDGAFRVIAEAFVAKGQAWVSSLTSASASERLRYIYQDTTPPTVTLLDSPSDKQDPKKILNIAEQKAPGRVYEVSMTASEPGKITLYVNGVARPTFADFPGQLTVDVTFKEGANELYAVAQDGVGNLSPIPPKAGVVYYNPTVDTTPPTLEFLNPAGAIVKSGDDRDVRVQTDAISRTVTIRDNGEQKASGLVSLAGLAEFSYLKTPILTEGQHSLRADVSDAAGNPSFKETNVLVDTIAPQITLLSPKDNVTLSEADDAKPALSGFQAEVSFSTISTDAKSWTVELATGCDAAYAVCENTGTVASGTFTNVGGVEPSLFPTILPGSTPRALFRLTVTDQVGNVATRTARVTLDLSACKVGLTGVTQGGALNNSLCPTAGSDCAEIQRTLTATVPQACGAVDVVRLYVNSVMVEEKPVTGQKADFVRTFADGTAPVLEVRVFNGTQLVDSTGAISVIVDLRDPVVAVKVPGGGSGLGLKADKDSVAPGLQIDLGADVADANLVGGKLTGLRFVHGAGTDTLAPANLSLPYTFGVASESLNFINVTLADQTNGQIQVTVTDSAGNETVATAPATVDLLPPAAIVLAPITAADIDPRRPAVRLGWTASGDNGFDAGTKAVSYDIRYSPTAIVTDADFEAACRVTNLAFAAPLPVPGVAGSMETYTLTGPDIRSPDVTENGIPCKLVTGSSGRAGYTVAVRAIDDVGNASPIGVASVASVDLSLRFALVHGTAAPYTDPIMQRIVNAVGDVNGDGKADLAIGGASLDQFCVVYGHADGDKTVPDVPISAATGPHHQCFTGTGNWLGTYPTYIGDVNGDGVEDLGVGEGKTGGTTFNFKIWFGVKNGTLAAAPNVTITGIKSQPLGGVAAAGGGNFNNDVASGKPVKDILVGSRNENRAYLVPGNPAWNAATNLTIDLQNAANRTANAVVTFEMITAAGSQFGANVAFVKDVNGDGYDEAAVSANSASPTQVVVFKGRDVTAAVKLTVTADATGGSDPTKDDKNVVRLLPDDTAYGDFGIRSISGLADLDGDGKGDVVVGHYKPANQSPQPPAPKTIYGFYSKYLNTRFGSFAQVKATAGTGSGILRNDNGFVITGSYDRPVFLGNFDNDPVGSVDIGYTMFSLSSSYGKTFVRANVRDPGGAFEFGAFPWESPVLVDPQDPNGVKFGYTSMTPVGDFNGDGLADIAVGTAGAGYVVILY